MRPDLQKRFLKVSDNLDRLEHIASILQQSDGTHPRALVASAAIAGAEFLAAVTGQSQDTGLIYRAYEEVVAALESSPAINEMLTRKNRPIREASARVASTHLMRFRALLASVGESNE